MKRKSIIRWTLGSNSELAFNSLVFSINKFKKIYKDRFDLYVCYNNIDVNELLKLPVKFVNQKLFINEICCPPPKNGNAGTAWKLYPPRLGINTHEIFIDNDVVVYKSLEEIEYFLETNDSFILTESYQRSYSDKFINDINKQFNINTGIIGLPPFFNFKVEINKIMMDKTWNSHFDEQSVVAIILQDKKVSIINRRKIEVAYGSSLYNIGTHGVHFVGLNGGESRHWNEFLKNKIL